MEGQFVILCCENIRPEVDAVLASGEMPRAAAESFPFHCGHVRSVWATVKDQADRLAAGGNAICLFGCGCANTLDIPPAAAGSSSIVLVDSGAPLFLSATLVNDFGRRGEYLILPGWLLRWKQNAASDKLDRTTAREMFRESLSGVVLLDTGVRTGLDPVLAEFSDFVGLPARTLPVGLEHLRFRISAAYHSWQCRRDMAACQALVSAAQKRVADYSMVADLTARIIGVNDERTVILRMLDLLVLLTSPKRAGFLPLQDGVADDVISIPPGAYTTTEHFRKDFDPDTLYMRTDGGGSYRFHVRYDEDLIGILAVDEVTIPEALDEYINLTHFISQIAGLSITIARAHQELERIISERNDEIAWRKKAEQELSLHSQILLNMAEGVALIRTEDGSIAFTNTRFNEMFGYAKGELIGQNIAMLNAADTRSPEDIASSIEEELGERGVWTGEIKNIRKDRSEFWCHAIVSTYNHPAFGKVWITVHEDITEQKLVQAALAGSEQRYRQLYEGMRDAFVSFDLDGRITGFNTAFEKIIGYTSDELYALTTRDLTPHRWQEDEDTILHDQVLHRGYSDIYEKELCRRDKTTFPVELRTSLIRGDDGTPQGMWAIVRDISQRKAAERALAESEERYRTIIENIQDVFFRVSADNRIEMASPSATKMFGYASAADMIGKPVTVLWKDPSRRTEFLDTMRNGNGSVEDWEAEFVRSDGTPFWVSISAHLHTGSDGQYGGTEGIIRDISERKKLDEALKSTLKKLNMLSSITRHDILNQVMGLRAFLELSKEDLKGTKFETFINKEDQAAEAIQRQIEFTKYYQDIGVNEPRWQELGPVIHEALAQLKPQGIDARVDVGSAEVFADPLIVKVFFNLMENSLRHGEHVTKISFTAIERDSGLLITYQDDGAGITGADKKRLFQKGFGKHTGLGLFLSREILAITGITISENGVPGTGVLFELMVPPGGYRLSRQ